jgi:pimeloyl-ACP methyl ester carboxylesterase
VTVNSWIARHRLLVVVLVIVVGGLVVLRGYTWQFQRSCADAHPPEQFVSVDGIRLHYVERGAGPPVVLLHGDGGSTLDFTMSPLVELLAERYRVIAIDRPGHGHSDPAATPGSLREQATLVRGAVLSLEEEEPVLVGHSRGASVVAAILDRYPEAVAAAVSVGGDMLGETDPGEYGAYRPGSLPVVGSLLVGTVYAPAVRANDYALLRDGLDRAFAPEGPAPDDYVEAYGCQWVRPSNIRATYRLAEDVNRVMPEIRGRFGQLETPVVIVHGDADGNVDPADARRLHEAIDGSVLRLLPGVGHEPQFTQPEAVADAIDLAADEAP